MEPDNPQNWETQSRAQLARQPAHRRWLSMQANALLDFFEPNIINRTGGFHTLDLNGQPSPPVPGSERHLHDTTRIVHCFAIANLLDRPGADDVIDHGMNFLWTRHRDPKNGGYFWGVDDAGPSNSDKQAYGHAFVLLAASSASVVGHPDANRLLADVSEILMTRFWEPSNGTTSEEYSKDWQPLGDYHGQNSNMHLTEALMAAHEATGNNTYLDMACSIAELIINRHAREQGWRVAEHFDAAWQVDQAYTGDPIFRPKGITPGHALEWSRLLIQLWQMRGQKDDWMPGAAKNLFLNAVNFGWDVQSGGLHYTLDWNNQPDQSNRLWWPCAEGIAAAAVLAAVYDDSVFESWYRRIWGFVDGHFIDHSRGGWFAELDAQSKPHENFFSGKPDLYHAFQACLIPLEPNNGSITRALLGWRTDTDRRART